MDLQRSILQDGENLAIPESFVTRSTRIFLKDYVSVFKPNPVLKRNIVLKELSSLKSFIRLENEEIDLSPYTDNLDGAEVSDIPKLAIDQFRVDAICEDMDMQSILQFSTNPYIPLQEYVRKYDELPLSVINMTDIGNRERSLRLNNLDIRSEQELRWCQSMIDIFPDYMIIDFLEEQRDQLVEPTPKETMISLLENICEPHQISPLAGLDQDLNLINIVSEDCIICVKFKELFRAISLEQHSVEVDDRSMYRSIIDGLKSRLIFQLWNIGHNPRDIRVLQQEDVDIFAELSDSSDNEAGGLFSMFE
jgi:hypothetical protein